MTDASGIKVLFVDDEPQILELMRRQFFDQYSVATAINGRSALRCLVEQGPFSVIVSDLRMPQMDGITFLSHASQASPDSVRIMMTAYADLDMAVQAVNQGHIFLFLTKPCPPESLDSALRAAAEQYRLIRAERDLLENTLHGSVKVLTEMLALVHPSAFGRSSRITRAVCAVAELLSPANTNAGKPPVEPAVVQPTPAWQFELASMLSQIGCITLPAELVRKAYDGEELSTEERTLFDSHPPVGCELIAHIPRLREVSRMIGYQEKHYDGSGIPDDAVKGREIPLGARILKAVLDHDSLVSAGASSTKAFETVRARQGWYDPAVLSAFESVLGKESTTQVMRVLVWELRSGMVLTEDVRAANGNLLIARGYERSDSIIRHLVNYARTAEIREPIGVIIPNLRRSGARPKPSAESDFDRQERPLAKSATEELPAAN